MTKHQSLPPVLEEILEKQAVRDGDAWIDLHSHMSRDDGWYLQDLIRASHATTSLEVGMAYGVSTLFICDALQQVGQTPSHLAIDPFQHRDWGGIGLKNVARAGFGHFVELIESPSEYVLPQLAQSARQFDFALVDGWHSFDQALVEFFYIDRMLREGGIVAFDDGYWPGISKLMRFIVTLPGYQVYRTTPARPSSVLGRARLAIADSRPGKALLHPSVRRRTWDLGIHARCVAFRKVGSNLREMRFFEDF